MGHLTQRQIAQIRLFLVQRCLTYEPLQAEMLDHLSCDIEKKMQQGYSFEEAWAKVTASIPENQFNHIQNETMELINKKFKATDIFTMLSLFLLVTSSVFKMMHFPGAGIMLIAAFAVISFTLLLGVFQGFSVHAEGKGNKLVLLIVLPVIIFITSISFQLLHLAGANALRNIAIFLLLLIFPAIAIYFFRRKHAAKGHRLLILLDKHEKKIEYYLLALLGFGTIFKLFSSPENNFVSVVFFILVFVMAGMFYFAWTWKQYTAWPEQTTNLTPWALLISSIAVFVLFMLPSLGAAISLITRIVVIWSAYIIISGMVVVHYLHFSSHSQRKLLLFFSLLISLFPVAGLLAASGIATESLSGIISRSLYHIGVLTGLVILLFIFYKRPVFRAYMILILTLYMYNYPVAIG